LAFCLSLKGSDGNNAFDETGSWPLIWVTLGFSIAHMFLPMDAVARFLFRSSRIIGADVDYHIAKLRFKTVF
jgi:hypothetical protein